MKRIAARLGVTDGRLSTGIVVVIVAALLLPSLSRLHAPPSDALAAPTRASALEPVPDAYADLLDVAPPLGDFAVPEIGVTPSAPTPSNASGPRSSPPGGPPAPPPCAARSVNDQATQLLVALDAAAGGVLPDKSVVSVLAVATGCSEIDPAILAIAVLIDVGQSIPDLGLDGLEPTIPFVELPAPLVALLAPLTPSLGPVCAQIGTAAAIVFFVAPYYPAPINGVLTTTLFHALSVCGQLPTKAD